MTHKNETSVWKPVQGRLMTKWSEKIDPANVLSEYPRPQMVRKNWLNLNGVWEYAIKPADEDLSQKASEFDGAILVPFAAESALSGVRKLLLPSQRLWYRRTFTVPDGWAGQKLLLHFGAVDWKAEVWINGYKVGDHTGGYYPFSFEISQYLSGKENELLIAVWDPTDTHGQERGKQVLTPGGIFYTPVSGIWQTVWLEPVPEDYIDGIKLTPDIDAGELTVQVITAHIAAAAAAPAEFEAIACDNGVEVAAARASDEGCLKLRIRETKLWSPVSPFLYDLKIRLLRGGKAIDEIGSYFGMRKFSVQADSQGVKRLFLNNRPLFQNGILDQGYWPDGLYTAPTEEALVNDIETVKKYGFNMIRKHIKVEPARWYYHCDRLGLIVWQDMINGGAPFSALNNLMIPHLAGGIRMKDKHYKRFGRQEKVNRENYKKELKEMIDALYNVPCIGMWVPFNEAWGQFDAAETAQWVRSYDPTRCIDHASGWNDQGAGDIKSLHTYFVRLKLPKRANGRAIAVTEYGGYSLKVKGHVWREDREFGYRRFTSAEYLQAAYTALIRGQVKPLIKQGLSAVVYTQLTDVETEINGLLTYDRAVLKLDPAVLADMHQELELPI